MMPVRAVDQQLVARRKSAKNPLVGSPCPLLLSRGVELLYSPLLK